MKREHDAAARDAVLRAVGEWADRGWLRRLDAALARFVAEIAPSADGCVLLATALLAQLEGQGHTCVAIDDLLIPGAPILRWTDEQAVSLRVVMNLLPGGRSRWIAALGQCDAVHVDAGGFDFEGGQPLVLRGGRLYLRRYWQHERRIATAVRTRAAPLVVDEPAARRWLDRLFAAPPPDDPIDWQKVACAIALRGRLSIVTGGPGTGKTWTAARFLALLCAMSAAPGDLRVALAAPTGKAAARLKQSIDVALSALQARVGVTTSLQDFASRIGPARTLHGLLGTRPGTRRFRHDAGHPLEFDVVIVDEASMVHVEMMSALLATLPIDARVLLLGDKDQLASVEAGAVLAELCRGADLARYSIDTARYIDAVADVRLPDDRPRDTAGPGLVQQIVTLRRSQRFDAGIGRLAAAVNAGDAAAAERLLDGASDATTSWLVPASPRAIVDLARIGYAPCIAAIRRGPGLDHPAWVRAVLAAYDAFRILCAVRDGEWGVVGINEAVEALFVEGRAPKSSGDWYEGRPVMVTRNDYGLGVYNGDLGIVLRASRDDPSLRAWFMDGDLVRSIGVARLAHVETAFAMTVHKSQGSEFDHTVLVLPPEASPIATRELVYTGITRARAALTLVSSRREALAEAIASTARRSSGLADFIDGT